MAKTLIEVLEESNIELISSSSERVVAHCPFHDNDDDPSFTVYPTGTYYCFGCHVWGDAVKFLVEYKDMTATEALEYVGVDYKQPKAEKSQVIKISNTVKTWEFLYDVAEQYHVYLQSLPGAKNYLLDRTLSEATIRHYKIGYTDGKVLNLTFAEERKLAKESGIMTKDGYETMSHRITIPNLLDNDRCDFLMGRTIINDRVKYLGTRIPKPLIGFHEVRKSQVIFIVEGQFDWLTLRQWGYPAICLSGTALKPYVRLPLMNKDLIFVPDIDDEGTGMKEMKKLAPLFGDKATILDISALRTEAGKMDVNSLAQTPDGEERFKQLVKERIPWIFSLSRVQLNQFWTNFVDTTHLALI